MLLLVTMFAGPTVFRALAGDPFPLGKLPPGNFPVHPLQLLVDHLVVHHHSRSIRMIAEAGDERLGASRRDESQSEMPPVKTEKRAEEREGAEVQAEATVESDTGGKAWQGGSWTGVARQKQRDGREGRCQQVRPSSGNAMDNASALKEEERAIRAEGHSRGSEHGKEPQAESHGAGSRQERAIQAEGHSRESEHGKEPQAESHGAGSRQERAIRAEGHSRERELGKEPQAESASSREGGREAEEASSASLNHMQPEIIEVGRLDVGGKAAARRPLGVSPSRVGGGHVVLVGEMRVTEETIKMPFTGAQGESTCCERPGDGVGEPTAAASQRRLMLGTGSETGQAREKVTVAKEAARGLLDGRRPLKGDSRPEGIAINQQKGRGRESAAAPEEAAAAAATPEATSTAATAAEAQAASSAPAAAAAVKAAAAPAAATEAASIAASAAIATTAHAALATVATEAKAATAAPAAAGESSALRKPRPVKGWTTSRWERDESFTWAGDEGKEKMVGLRDQPYTWHWPIEAVGDTWRLPSSKPPQRVNLRVRERREKGLLNTGNGTELSGWPELAKLCGRTMPTCDPIITPVISTALS